MNKIRQITLGVEWMSCDVMKIGGKMVTLLSIKCFQGIAFYVTIRPNTFMANAPGL